MRGDHFDSPALFKVGRVQAFCPTCHGERFVRSRRHALDKADFLTCSACGREYPRTTLMQQVTDEVIRTAEKALRRAEAVRAARQVPDTRSELAALLKEAEELLHFPGVPGHVERASKLFIAIARRAPTLAARNAAMNAVTLAAALGRPVAISTDPANLERLIARIREELG